MSVPYVIEGNGGTERVYDLYSRLLRDRIVFLKDHVDEDSANSIVAQMLFLEADNPEKDILFYINSPGGHITDMFAIYDTINYIKPDVSTICIGEASSAAAFLLAAGTKGKRCALKNARIMIHQASGGAGGHIEDMKIRVHEADFLNNKMLEEMSIMTKKSVIQLKKDMARDCYMSAEESKKYGIIDVILDKRG